MMLPDPRRNAFRPDLADVRLKGRVEAARFTTGRPMVVNAPIVPVMEEPRDGAMQVSQALSGEAVSIFDEVDGWAWAQIEADGYVGYIPVGELATPGPEPTHRVFVPQTLVFPEPDIKSAPVGPLYMGSPLTAVGEEGRFLRLANGCFAIVDHVRPMGENAPDPVAVAKALMHAPYLWGGRTKAGIDCSGLVQLALNMAGKPCPRDSDMQAREVGTPLPVAMASSGGLRRADLVFWKGHVAMMLDGERMIHANGHHMMVAVEPLREALARIEASGGGPVIAVRRP